MSCHWNRAINLSTVIYVFSLLIIYSRRRAVILKVDWKCEVSSVQSHPGWPGVNIESVHCREEGCIGKYTPRGPRDFPRAGILHPEAREIARGRSPRAISRNGWVCWSFHSLTKTLQFIGGFLKKVIGQTLWWWDGANLITCLQQRKHFVTFH